MTRSISRMNEILFVANFQAEASTFLKYMILHFLSFLCFSSLGVVSGAEIRFMQLSSQNWQDQEIGEFFLLQDRFRGDYDLSEASELFEMADLPERELAAIAHSLVKKFVVGNPLQKKIYEGLKDNLSGVRRSNTSRYTRKRRKSVWI